MNSKLFIAVLASAVAATLIGCGKDENASKTASAGSSAGKTAAPFVIPNDAPTERARQRIEREAAAAKLLDIAKPEPTARKDATPTSAVAAAPPPAAPAIATPTPAAAPPAAPAPTPAPAPKAEPPVQVALAAPAPAKAPEPARELPKAEPPKTVAPATSTRVVSREEPVFPREAVQNGVREGRVTARMNIDASGSVTRVDIVSAEPRNVFNRSVQRALQRWKFEPGADGRSAETEIVFRE
jgi:protein TonB